MNIELRSINKTVLVNQIIDEIGLLIVEGKLKPGDYLPSERYLADKFNVSRTSVRQALKALNVLGLIEISPGSKSYFNKTPEKLMVNPLRFLGMIHDIGPIELMETRIIIEKELIKSAVNKAKDKDIKKLEIILSTAKKNMDDFNKYTDHEKDFHDYIINLSGNRILMTLYSSINNLLKSYRRKLSEKYHPNLKDFEEHNKILEAFKQRDVKKAQEAISTHLEHVKTSFEKFSI